MNHHDYKAALRPLKKRSSCRHHHNEKMARPPHAVIIIKRQWWDSLCSHHHKEKMVRPLKVKTSCSRHHNEKMVMRASPNSDSLWLEPQLRLGGNAPVKDCDAISSHQETWVCIRVRPLRNIYQGELDADYNKWRRLHLEQQLGPPPGRQCQPRNREGGKLGPNGGQLRSDRGKVGATTPDAAGLSFLEGMKEVTELLDCTETGVLARMFISLLRLNSTKSDSSFSRSDWCFFSFCCH